jgi:multidrug efflux pump subunit AcrA (membrane-fusion protein)
MKMSVHAFRKCRNFRTAGFRAILTIAILAGIAAAGYAQVDRDELRDLPPVTFINYEGPHARLDTREEIRQIGVVLGRQISESEKGIAPTLDGMTIEEKRQYSYKFETGALNRYFVIHCVSGPEDGKIDADILGLGVDTGVDHIRNLRVIIQGYLQTAYDYNDRDALLLAEYITVYNAVYRGNWDYFTSRYKNQVIDNLTKEKAGLSIRYDEWPGRTLIVIPLGHGGLSSIDTTTISDRRVIEEMRREDDQGVPQRQELVNLLERESEQAERQAQAERDAVRQEENRIAEERNQNAQERDQIAQERQNTQDDQQAGRITQDEANQRQDELNRRDEAAQQRDQDLDRQNENLEQRRAEAQRLDEFSEQKADEAQQQRQDIARDQQAAIANDSSGIFGVAIEKPNLPMGRLVRLNPTTGVELRRSPLNTVHVRTVTFTGGRILAIAGENVGSGAVRLVEINQSSLEMARQGDDDIKTGSLLWVNGGDLYAITVDLRSNNSCYLGRFNTGLVLQAKSAVKVHPEASVTIQQGRLLTQREDGSPLLLNPADLTEAR